MFGAVLAANAFGLHVSSGFQLVLASVLVVVIASAIASALPSRGGDNWQPFAPHGWWAIGTAANILVWLFVGWEAGAQLAGDFRSPDRDLPRAMAFAFVIVTALYCGLGAATIAVTSGVHSRVPLADLIAVGFGRAGRDATAVLAVALTMGTMNVYIAGASKLIASLGLEGALPRVLAGDSYRSVPRRPLGLIAVPGVVLLVALVFGFSSTDALIRATSACFIGVYVLALLSAVRILEGATRAMAAGTFALVLVLAGFSSWYLAVPVVAAVAALSVRRVVSRPGST
jgi:amino acid efflux transporter